MYKKGSEIRTLLFESFNERDESFYYLAPDIIGSVATANLDMSNNTFNVDFITTDGRNMKLQVNSDSANKWFDNCEGENSGTVDFVREFISKSKEQVEDIENSEEDNLEEIVDEYGDIMGDEGFASNNAHIGSSKFDSDKTLKQTIAKTRRFYGDMGLGTVTW